MSFDRDAPGAEHAEERARTALAAGDANLATTLVLRTYGPEVQAFLWSLHRDEGDAAEVFAMFAEAIWKAAPTFEGRSSVRTWTYAVARRTSLRYRRDRRRREARFQPFPDDPALAEVEAKVRTETLTALRTEQRSRLLALRESLPPDEQTLLMLRVDRKLAWNDLVAVMHDEAEPPPSGDALKREAARLRKRFQTIKEKLREAARQAGLLDAAGT